MLTCIHIIVIQILIKMHNKLLIPAYSSGKNVYTINSYPKRAVIYLISLFEFRLKPKNYKLNKSVISNFKPNKKSGPLRMIHFIVLF